MVLNGKRFIQCFLVRVVSFILFIQCITLSFLIIFSSFLFSSTERKPNSIRERWNKTLDPALRKGQWTRADVETAMTLLRDLDCNNKNAKIATALKRGRADVTFMLKTYIIPALLSSSNEELVLSHDEDEFKASVDDAWVDVQKANGLMHKKNRVTTIPLATIAPLSQIVQDSNVANEVNQQKKKRRLENKSKTDEMVAKVRNAVITSEQERELANPNSKEKWVQDCQAAEKRLLDSGVTKEQLNSLISYYKSNLNEGLNPGGAPLFNTKKSSRFKSK